MTTNRKQLVNSKAQDKLLYLKDRETCFTVKNLNGATGPGGVGCRNNTGPKNCLHDFLHMTSLLVFFA